MHIVNESPQIQAHGNIVSHSSIDVWFNNTYLPWFINSAFEIAEFVSTSCTYVQDWTQLQILKFNDFLFEFQI